MDHPEVVKKFLVGIGDASIPVMEQAFHDHTAVDMLWTQPGLPDCTTIDENIGLMRFLHDKTDYASGSIEFRNVIAQDNIVMCERVDVLSQKDGSHWVTVPVNAVFEMNADGKIQVWREYFDPTELVSLVPAG
jgi:limonene-1,2-epoxide hydrolase